MKLKFFIVLSTIITCLLVVIVFADDSIQYSDLPNDHWAFNSISRMTELGILEGYGNGTFGPNDPLTRGQFAKLLVSSQDFSLINPQTPTFGDVKKEDWEYRYIEAAKEYYDGYIVGDKQYFNPDDYATRENVAVAMIKAKGLSSQEVNSDIVNNFIDRDDIDPELKNYIAIAINNNIMEGYGNEYFGPKNYLTRAEACELIFKSNKFTYEYTNPEDNSSTFDPENFIAVSFKYNVTLKNAEQIVLTNSSDDINIDINVECKDNQLIIKPVNPLSFSKAYIVTIPENSITSKAFRNENIEFKFLTPPNSFGIINDNYQIDSFEVFSDDNISFEVPKEFEFFTEIPEIMPLNEELPYMTKISKFNKITIDLDYIKNYEDILFLKELTLEELYISLSNDYPDDTIIKNDNNIVYKFYNNNIYTIRIFGKPINDYMPCITIYPSDTSDYYTNIINLISDKISETLTKK